MDDEKLFKLSFNDNFTPDKESEAWLQKIEDILNEPENKELILAKAVENVLKGII